MNKRYDPNQPRVPAGSSKGGQWAKREAAEKVYNTVIPHHINEAVMAKTSVETPNIGEKAIPYSKRGIEIEPRLKEYLDKLRSDGDYISGDSGSFSTNDVAILTTEAGVEFAVLTAGDKSFLVRGGEKSTTILDDLFGKILREKGTFDFHSHPYIGDFIPSKADLKLLSSIPWQKQSVIVDPKGDTMHFTNNGEAAFL